MAAENGDESGGTKRVRRDLSLPDVASDDFKEVSTHPHADAYAYETMTLNKPLFKSIHTVVVLTMEHSPKRPSYMWQLKNYRPCRHVVIQDNKGRAAKRNINNTAEDVFHAFVTACRYVKDRC